METTACAVSIILVHSPLRAVRADLARHYDALCHSGTRPSAPGLGFLVARELL